MTRRWIRKVLLIGLLVAAVAVLVWFAIGRQPRHNMAIDRPANAQAPKPEASAPGGPSTPFAGAIFVPPEKQQLIGMRSIAAEMGTLTKEIRIAGKVSYDETRLTHIHSKVSGYIEEVFADSVGKPIRAGDPLFTIYSPDLVATERDYLLALRSRDLLRESTLPSASIGAENLIAAAKERLRLWDVTEQEIQSLDREGAVKRAIAFYSPVNGVVMERAAYHHGTFVDPSKDLFTIVDLSHVWVLGDVYEMDLPFVRAGQAAAIELPYSGGGRTLRGRTLRGRTLHGRIDFIYPFLDPKSRTVRIRMEFANPDLTLKPEMFVNITLTALLGRQLLVPQDAVMDTGTEQYVFIDKGDGYVQPRQVKISVEAGDKAGIQQGLKPGERVITAANFIVDSESRLKGAFAELGAPSQPPKSAPGAAQAISVEVLEPKTAKTGMNAIRLLVKDASGKPIAGAQVQVALLMPQMGSMPSMSSKATLAEAGNGIYSGQIEFQMAWTWQATVTVRKGGNAIGTARTNITAR